MPGVKRMFRIELDNPASLSLRSVFWRTFRRAFSPTYSVRYALALKGNIGVFSSTHPDDRRTFFVCLYADSSGFEVCFRGRYWQLATELKTRRLSWWRASRGWRS